MLVYVRIFRLYLVSFCWVVWGLVLFYLVRLC